MIVKHLSEIIGSSEDIQAETWNSRRLLLRHENMGFSLHDTIIHAGTETYIWYKNHLEAVYCIEGTGEIELVDTKEVFPISPGMVYALDKHDKHYLRATTDMRMVCVFNPPLTGREVHDEDGVYPLMMDDDPYLSRVKDHAEVLERQDPVVHEGFEGEGPLTQEQLDFFGQNGYLFIEDFFTDKEIQKYQEESRAMNRTAGGQERDEIIKEPNGNAVRSIFAVHRDNEVFKKLSEHVLLQTAVQQILGSEVYVHQSRINFKPGFSGKEFYWHSDFETWHMEDGMPRMRALSCSIALEDNYAFNGPLMVIPGSHQKYISCVGATPDDHYKESLRKQEYGVPDQENLTKLVEENGIATPTGKAGSLLLFDCNIMHGSNGNITPYPRSNVFMVYNSVENKLEAPFGGTQPRPEYIAHRRHV